MCLRRNRNLKNLLWRKIIFNKKAHKVKQKNKKKYSKPCYLNNRNLCYTQVNQANTFSTTVTKKTYIFNKLSCKSNDLLHLMEDLTLRKQQYTGKSEAALNLKSKKHRKGLHKFSTLKANSYIRSY